MLQHTRLLYDEADIPFLIKFQSLLNFTIRHFSHVCDKDICLTVDCHSTFFVAISKNCRRFEFYFETLAKGITTRQLRHVKCTRFLQHHARARGHRVDFAFPDRRGVQLSPSRLRRNGHHILFLRAVEVQDLRQNHPTKSAHTPLPALSPETRVCPRITISKVDVVSNAAFCRDNSLASNLHSVCIYNNLQLGVQ